MAKPLPMTPRSLLFRKGLVCAGAVALLGCLAAGWLAHQRSLHTPDENGMYQQEGYWVQYHGPLDERSANNFSAKLTQLSQDLLTPDNQCYWAIVPDKAHYLPDEGWPRLDYDAMTVQVQAQLPQSFVHIDLTGSLSLGSYYKTDPHWRQETLQPVLDTLGDAMGFSATLEGWQPQVVPDFIGTASWYVKIEPGQENLVYLTSTFTEQAQVHHAVLEDTTVYTPEKLTGKNPYDVFLSGTTPFVTIQNPDASTDRELVIFRDSFASSLAPLLCQTYRTITLIDLRYMVSGLVPQYITFTNQDVLFLYSMPVVNQSAMLR